MLTDVGMEDSMTEMIKKVKTKQAIKLELLIKVGKDIEQNPNELTKQLM